MKDIRAVYVERLDGEEWGFHQEIADEFAAAGFKTTCGESGGQPASSQAIVRYYDKWRWDMMPYLIELDLRVIDPKDKSIIAWAKNRRTTLFRNSPRFMARQAIAALQQAPYLATNLKPDIEKPPEPETPWYRD